MHQRRNGSFELPFEVTPIGRWEAGTGRASWETRKGPGGRRPPGPSRFAGHRRSYVAGRRGREASHQVIGVVSRDEAVRELGRRDVAIDECRNPTLQRRQSFRNRRTERHRGPTFSWHADTVPYRRYDVLLSAHGH